MQHTIPHTACFSTTSLTHFYLDIILRSGIKRVHNAINTSLWERGQRVHSRLIGCDKGFNAVFYHMRHAFRRHMAFPGRLSCSIRCLTIGVI